MTLLYYLQYLLSSRYKEAIKEEIKEQEEITMLSLAKTKALSKLKLNYDKFSHIIEEKIEEKEIEPIIWEDAALNFTYTSLLDLPENENINKIKKGLLEIKKELELEKMERIKEEEDVIVKSPYITEMSYFADPYAAEGDMDDLQYNIQGSLAAIDYDIAALENSLMDKKNPFFYNSDLSSVQEHNFFGFHATQPGDIEPEAHYLIGLENDELTFEKAVQKIKAPNSIKRVLSMFIRRDKLKNV